MNTKISVCVEIILASASLLITGCRGIGTQRFTALAPTQESALAASSEIVLDVTCQLDGERADYNLWEDLSMLAPRPKRYKLDITFQVERVIKGAFTEKALRIHWLRDPDKQQCEALGIYKSPTFVPFTNEMPLRIFAPFGFTNGMPLRLGFDGKRGEKVRHLKILVPNE